MTFDLERAKRMLKVAVKEPGTLFMLPAFFTWCMMMLLARVATLQILAQNELGGLTTLGALYGVQGAITLSVTVLLGVIGLLTFYVGLYFACKAMDEEKAREQAAQATKPKGRPA